MKAIEKSVQKHQQAFAETLYEMRVENNYTQGELAVMAGVDRKTINRIENGHFSPSLDTMVRLAHAFGVPFGSVADTVSETVGA